jgi:hypothetical protein
MQTLGIYHISVSTSRNDPDILRTPLHRANHQGYRDENKPQTPPSHPSIPRKIKGVKEEKGSKLHPIEAKKPKTKNQNKVKAPKLETKIESP